MRVFARLSIEETRAAIDASEARVTPQWRSAKAWLFREINDRLSFMTPERWKRIDELFQAAMDVQPDQRLLFLKEACEGDTEIKAEVESLLEAYEQAGSFIDIPAIRLEGESGEKNVDASFVGRQISRYKVVGELGRGGMGTVYLARDPKLRRFVALKLLLNQYTKHKEHLRRFKQEALAASALNHPNIVTIYEIGKEGNAHFIATEFVEGLTLRQHLTNGEIEMQAALDVVIQVASALVVAHDKGILHRDIKPENIMVRPDGIIKVLDFGLAKLTNRMQYPKGSPESSTLPGVRTAPGMVMGTVSYMSPEQLRGISVDERTDIWSLGIVLYELLAGRNPFEGQTNSDVIAAILKQSLVPVVRYSPEVPVELQRILTKALRKNKLERYQTVKDLLIDLNCLKQDLELKAVTADHSAETKTESENTTTQINRSDEITEDAVPNSTARNDALRRAIRRYGLPAAFALILVIGITYGFYSFFSSSIPFQQYTEDKLPYSDKATKVAISPDGKYVAYVIDDKGEQSIQIAARYGPVGVEINQLGQIVAPEEGYAYGGLIFSLDGRYIYYQKASLKTSLRSLYKVHIAEKTPRLLIVDVDSPITLSPDGKRLAFIRFYVEEAKEELIIANADDGQGATVLAQRHRPNFFRTIRPSWSPDGKLIACATGSTTLGDLTGTTAVRVADGKEVEITAQIWPRIIALAWLPDSRGLLAIAPDGNAKGQIWHISYPGGKTRQITVGPGGYNGISLTQDSKTLATVQSIHYSAFWRVPNGDTNQAEMISSGTFLGSDFSLMPNGKVLYVKETNGHKDLWIMEPDGKNEKQLMNDEASDHSPVVTSDGRYIVFSSNREGISKGNFNIWRMDVDGTNLKQLTNTTNADNPSCSPDGRWVIYTASEKSRSGNLWKVSINGGSPTPLSTHIVSLPSVSPDGKLIACSYWDQGKMAERAGILPFEGGDFVNTFDIDIGRPGIRWIYEGRKLLLTYVVKTGGVSNVWSQPMDGSQPRQLTGFKSDEIFSFDWLMKSTLLVCDRGGEINNVVLISDSN